ncbi:Phospholipase [Actinidia chinensis var. chinensis]|uniref:Phospholipase n=1 Tax=Actinidia chinensis var. chinensis TaxID=1590841 RepID=A0A2R6QR48_ACTCC|nr:Phospholipase [Actinidia chinensis var. chinensis]
MGETSRSRVTITLGGTGQVVKRAGPVLDSAFSESQLAVGSKRSVRDRLGRDGDGFLLSNKRQRGESNKLTMHNDNGGDDMRLGKDDLRFKLIRKNMLGQVRGDIQRNGVDLRETLSRAAGHSTTSLSMRQRIPERADTRHRVPERKDASVVSQYPSTRSADALFQMDSLRKSYSPWTLDQLRQRSPDRGLRTSRNLLPQRRNEDVMRRPLLRTYDDARAVSYMSAVPYMTKPTIAAASGKPLVPLPAPPPQLSGVVHKNSYTGNEHHTVDGLLHSLGLETFAIYFKAEEVDMTALRQMGDRDLKELGIPMGPRKKILLALLPPRSKRPL